jgi:filamentous hemagglutinin
MASSTAQAIAYGHAYAKHGYEFGVYSPSQLAAIIEDIITNPSFSKNISRGRTAYWDNSRRAVVITDPSQPDGGTDF